MALIAPNTGPSYTNGTSPTPVQSSGGGGLIPSNGGNPYIPPTAPPAPGPVGNGTGASSYFGTGSAGVQPGGNNYPSNIYGAGPNGSGTALGLLTSQDLTSDQLTSLLNSNSPYIQQARNQAAQQANSRGALNSSIAAGNAQASAIQAGLPIAQADAQAALGLQTTNLNNLSKIQSENIGANAQMRSAAYGASAQMNVAAQNNAGALTREVTGEAFTGEQNQLNYERSLGLQQQGFMDNSALSAQGYQQNLGLDQFNLGASLLQGNQNFRDSMGLAAAQDPALMGDPTALGGYMDFINGDYDIRWLEKFVVKS